MKAAASDRNALLVLGMHRSGTSAFAGTLSRLGLCLPAKLMAPGPGNANGYFESWELARLHNTMLRTAATRWDDWSPISDEWFRQPQAAVYANRIAEFLEREFAGAKNFLIKDPRICRVVPVWRDALSRFGARPLVVVPLRHPAAVAQSLTARDGFTPGESHLLWLRHMLDAERATRDLPRVFVAFDELLEDWRETVSVIAARLEWAWPRPPAYAASEIDHFLDEGLRHHRPWQFRPKASDRKTLLALEGWEAFRELARRGATPDIISHLNALRDQLSRIPSTYRLPLGIGAIAGQVFHQVSKLRLRRTTAQAHHG